MQPNYHTLTNNAVFPQEGQEEVIHYHTKVTKERLRLAPTIRKNMNQENEPTSLSYGRSDSATLQDERRGYSPTNEAFVSEY